MKHLFFLLKAFLFWMFFFLIQRLIFIAYNFKFGSSISFSEIVQTAIHGLHLDFATTCYFVFISFWFLLFSFFSKAEWIKKGSNFSVLILLILSVVICLSNTLLYKEWQSIISKRALSFMLYPKEVIASLSIWYLIVSFLMLSISIYLFYKLWIYFVLLPNHNSEMHWGQKIAYLLLTPPLLLLGARGGFQLIPINESTAYFSTHTSVNHAAVNPIWYLGNNIWNSVEEENKYHFMQDAEANQINQELYSKSSAAIPLHLKNNRPNLIFLVLESHTADVLASLGGEKNICPFIDSLADNGILFTHIYGSGSRTDQGLVCVLSGFPALPDKSIIKYTAKVNKLPSLYRDLNQVGYQTSFYYGGETEFANIGAYLRQSGVSHLSDKADYLSSQINSKWGAHDEFVLNYQLKDLQNQKQPFFSVLLTLSNHEPFETPAKPKFEGNDEANKFRSTAAYTDKCLQHYFKEAAKYSWYQNTLFVLVADHGHRLPQQNDLNLPKSKHIPLLFFGEALSAKSKGLKIPKIGNQQDIAATLLAQLQLPSTAYKWSKNLLDLQTKSFGYYSNENVLGWISDSDTTVYSFAEQKNSSSTAKNAQSERNAKAYLQTLYQQFLAY